MLDGARREIANIVDDAREAAAWASTAVGPHCQPLVRLEAVELLQIAAGHAEVVINLHVDHVRVVGPEADEVLGFVPVALLLDERYPQQGPLGTPASPLLGEGDNVVDDFLIEPRFAAGLHKCVGAEAVYADRNHVHPEIDQCGGDVALELDAVADDAELADVDVHHLLADADEVRVHGAFPAATDVYRGQAVAPGFVKNTCDDVVGQKLLGSDESAVILDQVRCSKTLRAGEIALVDQIEDQIEGKLGEPVDASPFPIGPVIKIALAVATLQHAANLVRAIVAGKWIRTVLKRICLRHTLLPL